MRVGDADIEDVVQETLLAIHLKRHTWDGGLKLAPWVNAIARHKIIDAMRRRGARRSEPIEDFEAALAAPEAEDPHLRSDIERVMLKLAPASARHRDRDLARRPVDRRDGGAAFDERGRRARRAASRAEIPRRGLAERDAMKTGRSDQFARGRSGRRRRSIWEGGWVSRWRSARR